MADLQVTQALWEIVSDFVQEAPDAPDIQDGMVTQLVVEIVSDFQQQVVQPPRDVPTVDFDACAVAASHLREWDSYIAPDGVEYRLHAPNSRWVLSLEGSGMPPVEYISERGPFQHGETVTDFFLRPRVVQLLIRNNQRDRDNYWRARAALLDAIRPNRQPTVGSVQPGILRKYLSTGQILDLHVFIQQGPRFEPRRQDAWDEWAFQEILRFIAHDPVYFNPVQQSFIFGEDTDICEQLVFPITFPIEFCGEFNAQEGNVINYTGTWIEYPTIVITGPGEAFLIENLRTDEQLLINYELGAGQTITINLTYGEKTITLNDGTNLIGYLGPESDFGTFHLEPGNNEIKVTAAGTSGNSRVQFLWYRRYIGY